MLEAVENTAHWTTHKIISIRALSNHTADFVREQLPKIYSRELVDTIFEQPYCRINDLVEANIAKRQTASEYLKKLVSINVLIEEQVGRERIYLHPKLIKLITQKKNKFIEY
jgi:Fic family protein